ncbi:hypothetical protein H9P43_007240 [Blastocladiella emersonii ATCC 22665]|nr:hypothetical protein H9P43_007240 [Blastocladiella emersonii ATCC 22665]
MYRMYSIRNLVHRAGSGCARRWTSTSGTTTTTAAATPKGWRKYAGQFKDKPGSHDGYDDGHSASHPRRLIHPRRPSAFLILHEATAVLPIGLFYYAIDWSGVQIPFPESILEESNARIQRVVKYYNWDVQPDSRVMLHLVAAYALVKVLLPVRIAASVWMTPGLARVIDRTVQPVRAMFRRGGGK